MSRVPRSAKVRPIAGNVAHQVFVVIATGATLGLAALATDGYIASSKHESAAVASGKTAGAVTGQAPGQSDEEIYTGSILYMPNDGKVCRQLLFDNQTGQLTDNGYVGCEQAAYNGIDGPKHWTTARIRVIASGFRGE